MCLKQILQKIKNMTKSNKNEMKEDHKNKYNDLAPINTLSQDDIYIQALNWAFMNPSIKNIALTGAYGSGKSSILYNGPVNSDQY